MATVDPSLRAAAEAAFAEARSRFPLQREPVLVWKALRVSAGIANYLHWRITLSRTVLTTPEAVRETFLHEYAHLLAVERAGKAGAGHGPAWRQAMRDLGLEPKVKHTYPVERNQPRQEVIYRCQKCGREFSRSKRLPRHRIWSHKHCGGRLRLKGVRRVTPVTEAT